MLSFVSRDLSLAREDNRKFAFSYFAILCAASSPVGSCRYCIDGGSDTVPTVKVPLT